MKYLKHLLLVLFLVVLDQIAKFYFIGKDFIVFSWFSLRYLENTGTTFGLFRGFNLFFIFSTFIVIVLVLYCFKREKKYRLEFSLILAGAFGNLFDRIFRGFVVDFIDFKFWYVFNLADAFVVVGVLILIYKLFKEKG